MPHGPEGGNLHHDGREDDEPLETLREHPRRPEEDAANVNLADNIAVCVLCVVGGARDAAELRERE
eukprot:2095817-Prymnesium_polylepis.2